MLQAIPVSPAAPVLQSIFTTWCFIFNYWVSFPSKLQGTIIWAKKYCFYLRFQTLRGSKLLRVYTCVLKKEKCNFYVGFQTFCSPVCPGLQVLVLACTQQMLVNMQLVIYRHDFSERRAVRTAENAGQAARQSHPHPVRRAVNRVLGWEESLEPSHADFKIMCPKTSHLSGETCRTSHFKERPADWTVRCLPVMSF